MTFSRASPERERFPHFRFFLFVVAVAALEGLGFALARPAGERLRPLVDLYTLEGLLLAVVGALLVVDRPFLGARTLARRLRGEEDTEEPVLAREKKRNARRFGYVALGLGGSLFALASILWAFRPAP